MIVRVVNLSGEARHLSAQDFVPSGPPMTFLALMKKYVYMTKYKPLLTILNRKENFILT